MFLMIEIHGAGTAILAVTRLRGDVRFRRLSSLGIAPQPLRWLLLRRLSQPMSPD